MSRFAASPRPVVPLALVLCALWAGSAAAATTHFASPGGTTGPSACTDVASPCSLPVALGATQAEDTVSLAAGTYNVQALALPKVPLHWVATNRATRPVLTSAGLAATVFLTSSQSGSIFEGLEINNTSTAGPAFGTNDGVDATVRSTVLKGPHCVSQPDGDQVPGELTIEDSMLSSPVGRTCATLGPSSILRRSVVSLTDGIATQTPPAAVVSEGLVEDTQISGGVQLVGTAAVARRVTASGWTGIFGEGLVVDSVARAFGSLGAAVAADAPHGGALRVINVTAIAPQAPALEARSVFAASGTSVNFNTLVVSNSVARGAPTDLRATTSPRNQSGDPLFTDPAAGDFRPRPGSPAIDAGQDPQGRALPTDADGHPRVQGAAIDLGAYEFSPPPPGGAGAGPPPPSPTGTPPPADTAAPTLGRLRLSRARFRIPAGTRLTTTTSEIGQLRVAIQRRSRGRRARWTAVGSALSRRAAMPGAVKLAFSGRIGTRRLLPGRYRFVVNAIDAAGNRSAPRTISFTILPATR